MKLKKTYYLITQKSFDNNNILDVGVFIEKIILSTESEDFKSYWEFLPNENMEEVFQRYEEEFNFYYHDVLRKECKDSLSGEFMIYSHLLMDEDQFKSLMKQTEDIPLRGVLVTELG